jgi:hypothetical protein
MSGPTGAQVFNGLSIRAKFKVVSMALPDLGHAAIRDQFLKSAEQGGGLQFGDFYYDYKVGIGQVMDKLIKEAFAKKRLRLQNR